MLENALDPNQGVTPAQLQDLMEMFITDLHLRKVLGEPWMATVPLCTRGMVLASQIEAEGRLLHMEGMPPEVVKKLEGAIDLSLQEISELRKKLLEKLVLLKQCPLPSTILH